MPTQVRGVYADVHTWENLYTAYLRAAHGKRSQEAVARFERRLEDNLVTLQDDLMQQTYRPGAYTNFTIHESKRRVISAAPFRDRVVHHALCQVIEPAFEASFINNNVGFRVASHGFLRTWCCLTRRNAPQRTRIRRRLRLAPRG